MNTDFYDLIDEDVDQDYTIYILLVKWPKDLKLVAAQMIAYDLLYRYEKNSNVESERIGDYSVSYGSDPESVGDSYPKEIMKQLYKYRKMSVA